MVEPRKGNIWKKKRPKPPPRPRTQQRRKLRSLRLLLKTAPLAIAKPLQQKTRPPSSGKIRAGETLIFKILPPWREPSLRGGFLLYNAQMKTVFIQGSYDILNAGHVRSFQWLHDQFVEPVRIVVGLNTDELMATHKPGQPIMPFAQRREILEALANVDEVIACGDPQALPYLIQLNADGFATVQEWVERQAEAIDWIKARGGHVLFPPYYPEGGDILSSSMIRAKIRGQ